MAQVSGHMMLNNEEGAGIIDLIDILLMLQHCTCTKVNAILGLGKANHTCEHGTKPLLMYRVHRT